MSSNNYAGFWLRFVAYIIDAILIYAVQALIVLPVLGVLGFGFASNADSIQNMSQEEAVGMIATIMAAAGATALVFNVLIIIYFAAMESSKYQATVGKIALGLKVTDSNGAKLDFVKALIRNVAKIISGMILCIGYIMAGFTEKKQALHDIIASTLVVKK
jgi:uncharacterized RDD family membrane protein YckC